MTKLIAVMKALRSSRLRRSPPAVQAALSA